MMVTGGVDYDSDSEYNELNAFLNPENEEQVLDVYDMVKRGEHVDAANLLITYAKMYTASLMARLLWT